MEINSQTDCITISYFLSHREEGGTRKLAKKQNKKPNNLGTDSFREKKDK